MILDMVLICANDPAAEAGFSFQALRHAIESALKRACSLT
jgi:hypothetical protein